jgi:hypothetical protein
MKELQLWIYTSTVLGQSRLVLVADHTVGGAKGRITSQHGTPHGKIAIPASTPGFPDWIKAPGVWFGIVPIPSKGGDSADLRGLDRYTQESASTPPKVLPKQEEAYVRGEGSWEAVAALESLQTKLLEANHSAALYKRR